MKTMKKISSVPNNPKEYVQSTIDQIAAERNRLEDEEDFERFRQYKIFNTDIPKYAKKIKLAVFLHSTTTSLNSSSKELNLLNYGFPIRQKGKINEAAKECLEKSSKEILGYLYYFIEGLDKLENPGKTDKTSPAKTLQEYIDLIHATDERLKNYKKKDTEGCPLLRVKSGQRRETIHDLEEVKKLETNAFILSSDNLIYYDKKADRKFADIAPQTYLHSKDEQQVMKNMLPPSNEDKNATVQKELSSEELLVIYGITGHHHIDKIDQIRENFEEFKELVLPYLEARKILAYANNDDPKSFPKTIPLLPNTEDQQFLTEYETTLSKLKDLQTNEKGLENLANSLKNEKEEKELAQKAQEKLKKEAEEKEATENAEKLKKEEQNRVEASKKDTPFTKLFLDKLLEVGKTGIVKVQLTSTHLSILASDDTQIATLNDLSASIKTSADNSQKEQVSIQDKALIVPLAVIDTVCQKLSLTHNNQPVTSETIKEELKSVYATEEYKDKEYGFHQISIEGKQPKPMLEPSRIEKKMKALDTLIENQKLDLRIQSNREHWQKQVKGFGGGLTVKVIDKATNKIVECRVPDTIARMHSYVQTYLQTLKEKKIEELQPTLKEELSKESRAKTVEESNKELEQDLNNIATNLSSKLTNNKSSFFRTKVTTAAYQAIASEAQNIVNTR